MALLAADPELRAKPVDLHDLQREPSGVSGPRLLPLSDALPLRRRSQPRLQQEVQVQAVHLPGEERGWTTDTGRHHSLRNDDDDDPAQRGKPGADPLPLQYRGIRTLLLRRPSHLQLCHPPEPEEVVHRVLRH